MKFYNYLNESYWDSYIDAIKSDCKPFLKNWDKYRFNFWWTGRRYTRDFDQKSVRKNRTPKDTPLELHEFVDNWFKSRFGIRFRSNAVFCTSDDMEAENYGNLYAIFPIGKYTFLCSPTITDLWTGILDETTILEWNRKTDEQIETYLEVVEERLTKANYQKDKFYNNREIMLHCKEYYILSYYDVIRNERLTKEDFIL